MTSKSLFACLLTVIVMISCHKEDIKPQTLPLSFEHLDKTIKDNMAVNNIPAVSIAIVKDEKLVYAKSYGLADFENPTKADVNSLFRTASVSKPITAITILKLVQDGALSLDQKIFGKEGILGNDFGTPPDTSKKCLITVRHLINHESGWTNTPNDPTFVDVNITGEEMIKDVLANRPLSYTPGSKSSYLNFGYCILARVIEKVTGQSYENYVKKNTLEPCGITDMVIGGNTLAERFPHEVVYYNYDYYPYSFNLRRGDGAGGWIASATSLARFMVHIDRNPVQPDLVSADLLNQFYFGFSNWIHFGQVSGTSAIVNRLNDNISFVILANTSANGLNSSMNYMMTYELSLITNWPDQDLF